MSAGRRESVEALVVGGGPAGSATAALLARAGVEVLLCEATKAPRDAVCGEYLHPSGLDLLEALGARASILALGPRRPAGMAVVAPCGATVLGRPRPAGERGLSLRRRHLDETLLAHAAASGAAILRGMRVSDLERAPAGGYRARLSDGGGMVHARVLVGADGRRSLVARSLGLARRSGHRRWAAMAHFRSGRPPLDHGEMVLTGYGYCGINPLPDGLLNVCLVFDPRRIGRRAGGAPVLPGRTDLSADLAELLDANPVTRLRLEGAVPAGPWRAVGPIASRSRRAAADDALLVGDAAGFYDPFTGEGVGSALEGAFLVAEVLVPALRRCDTRATALGLYDRLRRRAFAGRLRVDRALQTVIRHPWLADVVARRMARRPETADRLAGVVGGGESAAGLLHPSFWGPLLLAGARRHALAEDA